MLQKKKVKQFILSSAPTTLIVPDSEYQAVALHRADPDPLRERLRAVQGAADHRAPPTGSPFRPRGY